MYIGTGRLFSYLNQQNSKERYIQEEMCELFTYICESSISQAIYVHLSPIKYIIKRRHASYTYDELNIDFLRQYIEYSG